MGKVKNFVWKSSQKVMQLARYVKQIENPSAPLAIPHERVLILWKS
jgi:hypothetical protein